MSELSTLLGNKGARPTFTHAGRTYTLSYVTQKVKTEFETWLKRNALQAVAEARSAMSPDVWQEAFTAISHDLASRNYAFHGEVAQKALKTSAGCLAFSAILFGTTEEDMLGLMTERGEEVRLWLETLLSASAAEGDRPNG